MLTDYEIATLETAIRECGQLYKSNMGGITDHLEMTSSQYWEAHSGEVNARPTAEVRDPGKAEPADRLLELHAWASSRLKRVAEVDPKSAEYLEIWHGDAGHAQGRPDVLIRFTDAAKKLDEYSQRKRAGAVLQLNFEQRIANELIMENVKPVSARTQIIERARVEANALYYQACAVWRQVIPVPVRPPGFRPPRYADKRAFRTGEE